MSWSYLDKWDEMLRDLPRYEANSSPKIRGRGETLRVVNSVINAAIEAEKGNLHALTIALDELFRRQDRSADSGLAKLIESRSAREIRPPVSQMPASEIDAILAEDAEPEESEK